MAPLIVQIATTLVARWFVPWKDAVRIGMTGMFVFTGASHFSSLRHDLAAMIPPPLTGSLPLVYLTGVLEIVGALGLLTRWRGQAAIFLVVLLLALFPANVYAAVQGLTLGGAPATALWLRTPLQLFWMATLWWSTVGRPTPITS